jgi:hypothetical protein
VDDVERNGAKKMSSRLTPAVGAALIALVLTTSLAAQTEKGQLRSIEQFDQVLDVPTGGPRALSAIPESTPATKPKRVQVLQWIISENQRISIPVEGTMLIELKAGELATIIGGMRVERREGEFWTVPKGANVIFETQDDSAVIETTIISDPAA